MTKQSRYFFLILLIYTTNFSFSQVKNGRIKVRKSRINIVGKTLFLYDLRTKECGNIFFETKEKCVVNFRLDSSEVSYLKLIPFDIPETEKLACTYSILTDTSLELKYKKFTDTCTFEFLSKENNYVKLKNTPYGIFEGNNFAVFYHFDKLIYSQSYKQSFADIRFTDSISKIDTVYNFIRNKKAQEEFKKAFDERLKSYKTRIKSQFFKGNFEIIGNKILLSKNDNPAFASLYFVRNSNKSALFSNYHFEKSYPLISEYTHIEFGGIKFSYDKCYLSYYDPKSKIDRQKLELPSSFRLDTFSVNYLKIGNPIIFSEADSFLIKNTKFLGNVKIKDIVSGYYDTYILSLNGNKIFYNSLYFYMNNAVEMKNKEIVLPQKTWRYSVKNNILFLYNEKDTLIDEMKNSSQGFCFTYHNNEPYVLGHIILEIVKRKCTSLFCSSRIKQELNILPKILITKKLEKVLLKIKLNYQKV